MPQKIDLGFIKKPKIDLGFLNKQVAPPSPGQTFTTVPADKLPAPYQAPARPAPSTMEKAGELLQTGISSTMEGLGIDPENPLSSVLNGIWNLGKSAAATAVSTAVPAMEDYPWVKEGVDAWRKPAIQQFDKAKEEFRRGWKPERTGPNGTETPGDRAEAAGHMGMAVVHGVAGAVPFVGPAAVGAGEEMGNAKTLKDFVRGGGHAVGLVGGLASGTEAAEARTGPIIGAAADATKAKALETAAALPKITDTTSSIASKIKNYALGAPPTAVEGAMRSIKPKSNNTQFKANLPDVLSHLKDALPDLGRPLSEDPNQLFQDALDLTRKAKEKLWAQRSEHLDPSLSDQVDATPVANSIVSSIPTKTWIKSPETAAAMAEEAAIYRQPHKLSDLEDMLHTTNAELDAYYEKYPGARRVAAAKNPETAALFAEGEALRKLIYNHVDDVQGQAGPAAEASRRYGKLLNFEEELHRRKNVFERQQPNSLQQQMGKLAVAKELGVAGAKIGAGLLTGNPEAIGIATYSAGKNLAGAWAIKKMSDFLKERGSAANMLRSAITDEGIQAPRPLSAPYTPYTRPLLRLNPASEAGGVRPSSGQTFNLPPDLEGAFVDSERAAGRTSLATMGKPPQGITVNARTIPRVNELESSGQTFNMPPDVNPERALPPATTIFAPEGEGLKLKDLNATHAASEVVRDPKTGRMKKVFTSESGAPTGKFNLREYLKGKGLTERGSFSLKKIGESAGDEGDVSLGSFGSGRFFSRIAEAVKEKAPVKAAADQFLNIVEKAGIKESAGLRDWLKGLGKEKVSRSEVMGKIREETPQLDEHWIGGKVFDREARETELWDLGTDSPEFKEYAAYKGDLANATDEDVQALYSDFVNETLNREAREHAISHANDTGVDHNEVEAPLEFEDWAEQERGITADELESLSSTEMAALENGYDTYTDDLMDRHENGTNEFDPNNFGAHNPDTRPGRHMQTFREFVREADANVRLEDLSHEDIISLEDEYRQDIQEAIGDGADFGPEKKSAVYPKFSQYTLPGGTNYREYVATLPGKVNEGQKGINFGDWLRKYKGDLNIDDVSEPVKIQLLNEWAGHPDTKNIAKGAPVGETYKVPGGHAYGSPDLDVNRLLHARVKDRQLADGSKSLFLEELQSDWHQTGRSKGYKGETSVKPEDLSREELIDLLQKNDPNGTYSDEDMRSEFGEDYPTMTKQDALDQFKQIEEELPGSTDYLFKRFNANGVPDAPFKKDWHELGMKRMLQEAADNGYDSLSWTTGKQQAKRYSLSKHVDAIQWDKNPDGTYSIVGRKDGTKVVGKDGMSEQELADTVGKDLAEKIVKGEGSGESDIFKTFGDPKTWKVKYDGYHSMVINEHGQIVKTLLNNELARNFISTEKVIHKELSKNRGVISGQDLDIGGEGMKGFYDNIIPRFMDKYLKKYGVKAEKADAFIGGSSELVKKHGSPETWKIKYNGSTSDIIDQEGRVVENYRNNELAKKSLDLYKKQLFPQAEVWSVKITPKMREDLKTSGQPIH